jgi:nucleotide-binding universal stress UspA family protein
MAFKNLLVHVDDTASCAARLRAAATLAQSHGAHLTGLYVVTYPVVPAFIQSQLPVEALALQERGIEELAAKADERYRAAMESAGQNVDLRIDRSRDVSLAGIVTRHARYADLTVLGQVDPDEEALTDEALPEQVAMGAGRPVLVLPYTYREEAIGRRVVIAWDASREATRAINDALPLLDRAGEVEVVTINPGEGAADHGEEPGADIALHLARHGVTVGTEHLTVRDIGIADALLSHLSDRGADLLVMGAYAHSRVRELVLGGVTREILGHMTVPVLMSH